MGGGPPLFQSLQRIMLVTTKFTTEVNRILSIEKAWIGKKTKKTDETKIPISQKSFV